MFGKMRLIKLDIRNNKFVIFCKIGGHASEIKIDGYLKLKNDGHSFVYFCIVT